MDDFETLFDLKHLNSLSLNERQDLFCKCLKHRFIQYENIHSDYYFWLITIQYWYTIRHLTPVYLYAIIISLIKTIYLSHENTSQIDTDIPSFLLLSINDQRNSTIIDPIIRQTMNTKLKNMSKKVYNFKKFDCSIIHEFNCLQTIYMFSMKVNEFFQRPFNYQIPPYYFLFGSFFYAFVEHYETKRNLTDALNDFFQKDTKLLGIINELFTIISTDYES